MRIIVAPDPVLRQKCSSVTPEELPKLTKKAKQMAKLMYKSEGCGLAAPQVGIAKRLIVIDTNTPKEGEKFEPNPTFLVNPVLSRLSDEKDTCSEGCLSIPGISIDIERATELELDALDLDGNEVHIEASGFAARALQHELDHLDGITMFEHLDPISRIEKLQEFEQAKAAGAKPGDTGTTSNAGDTGTTKSSSAAGVAAPSTSAAAPSDSTAGMVVPSGTCTTNTSPQITAHGKDSS
ncbi:MAG: peptide deformylase [Coriobacteriales bacterium]|jgi:peptide deformylase|nr:peptide deformylase [Coriobacteriales bacterium]